MQVYIQDALLMGETEKYLIVSYCNELTHKYLKYVSMKKFEELFVLSGGFLFRAI
jgi:hypothetical protein